MTTQQKLVQKKLSLLEPGEYLQNVSEARRIHGCSRQHFYEIKKTYESQGLAGLRKKTAAPRSGEKYRPHLTSISGQKIGTQV